MKNKIKITLAITLALMMVALNVMLIACDDDKTYYNNETDNVVFATQPADGVFNPFFSTSAVDGSMVGLTQIGMLGNDKDGNEAYGPNEAVVTLDYEEVLEGPAINPTYTTYKFVLKNNVKFSNGSPLTIKDVLFNLYVYLDTMYTGSSTIYSTDIVGLKAYRTQTRTESEQDAFMKKFEQNATTRKNNLLNAWDDIVVNIDENAKEDIDLLRTALQQYKQDNTGFDYIVDDFEKAVELFREELQNDFNNARGTYEDIDFKDKEGNLYKNLLKSDNEAFLYNENEIKWNRQTGKLESSLTTGDDFTTIREMSEAEVIDYVFNRHMPANLDQVLDGWATSATFREYLVNDELSRYNANNPTAVPNIEGIKFANFDEACEVNGISYGVPEYNQDGSVKDGYNEVLTIKINGVDPKAKWNFSFGVAPMYYYSDKSHIDAFNYAENRFGVERGNSDFMQNVIKDPEKIGVPVGAGPYAASKASGGITNIKGSDFRPQSQGVIYFERNPYFVMGPAKIKTIRYSEIDSKNQLNSLYNGSIDFAEPNAKKETEDELKGKKKDGIGYDTVDTMGYGYIGINASKVPSLNVRQAIMHSIDTLEIVNYYKGTAEEIYRSMSKSSWAYPSNAIAYYPYIGGPIPTQLGDANGNIKSDSELLDPIDEQLIVNPDYIDFVREKGKKAGERFSNEEQIEFLQSIIEADGYLYDSNRGYYYKGQNKCEYEFAIAGNDPDHPAYSAMLAAGQLLEKVGMKITVRPRSDALTQLASGGLTVWAAAWGSTIDPDMYQVYHKDSTATSTLNWGYRAIKANAGGRYSRELAMVNTLSQWIEEGRETLDQPERERTYHKCLNEVMRLAVELPTYQRQDLYAYNFNKIDESTFTPEGDRSAFKGIISEMYILSMVVKDR